MEWFISGDGRYIYIYMIWKMVQKGHFAEFGVTTLTRERDREIKSERVGSKHLPKTVVKNM